MHFVAFDGSPAFGFDTAHQFQGFVTGDHRFHIKQTQSLGLAGGAFGAVRVAEAQSQHLITATQSDHPAAAPHMRRQVLVPALFPQEGQIAEGRLGAGYEDEISIAGQRVTGLDDHHVDVGFGGQRVEVVEIGDAGQTRHGDFDRAAGGWPTAFVIQGQGVLLGKKPGRRKERHDAETIKPRLLTDDGDAVVKKRRIAAEFVDDVALDQIPFGVAQQQMGADERRNDPAPVDVADQHNGHPGRFGKAHVGDVGVAQVDLRRAARPFDDDQVRTLFKDFKALQHCRQQAFFEGMVFTGLGRRLHLSADHHLGADVGGRFEQHRVHVHGRLDPGGPGLQGLGAADLAAAGGDGGIVRHVLRLERAHP